MISCPKGVKCDAVSTTIKPVTHTALAEVNKASRDEIPLYVAIGNFKKKPPNRIKNAKLPTNKIPGFTTLE
jgi:hypothetical protein